MNAIKRIYGIDNDDYHFADLHIDTAEHDQYAVANKIVENYRKKARIDLKD